LARCASIIGASWVEPETHSLAESNSFNLYTGLAPDVDPTRKIHEAHHDFLAQDRANAANGEGTGIVVVSHFPPLLVRGEAGAVMEVKMKAAHGGKNAAPWQKFHG
jgi:hypothetical protein